MDGFHNIFMSDNTSILIISLGFQQNTDLFRSERFLTWHIIQVQMYTEMCFFLAIHATI